MEMKQDEIDREKGDSGGRQHRENTEAHRQPPQEREEGACPPGERELSSYRVHNHAASLRAEKALDALDACLASVGGVPAELPIAAIGP